MFKASFLTPPDKIESELADMQQFLETPCNSDNPAALKERLDNLMVYMARSGKLKADSEHAYFELYNSEVMKLLKELAMDKMSTSTINKYLESACRDLKQLCIWGDRVNRSATHQIDSLRTLISYAKQERQYQ